ncbi:restriction endonuclease [Streptomyces sp. NPDC059875]|uniref:restriction endonuclease n=1 Tax=unclassified Streptomyces TaxID=2593676 RepID=UPI003654B7FC
MFDEDGSLDPLLKFLLYTVLFLAAAKMLWEWLTGTVIDWITVDLWGAVAAHPWWTALIVLGAVATLIFIGWLVGTLLDLLTPASAVHVEQPYEPTLLTYKMRQLEAMSPTGFEHACAELLARDGFIAPRRVGGAGDLGADVITTDPDGLTVVVQCKQLSRPVASPAVQQFNGTARPEHGAHHAVIIGLNGFTKPARDFAAKHNLIALGREDLKRWAHGTHLYDIIRAGAPSP